MNKINLIFNFDGKSYVNDSIKNKLALKGEVKEVVLDFNKYSLKELKEQAINFVSENENAKLYVCVNNFESLGGVSSVKGKFLYFLSRFIGDSPEVIVIKSDKEVLLF